MVNRDHSTPYNRTRQGPLTKLHQSEPRLYQCIQILGSPAFLVRAEPDLRLEFPNDEVNFYKTVLMDDCHRTISIIPYIQFLIPQKCIDVVPCYRSFKPVNPALPARIGGDRIWKRGFFRICFHANSVIPVLPDSCMHILLL